MDCGPGILVQIKKAGMDVMTLDTIFLSHFHLDHCSDVFPLLLYRYLKDANSNQQLTIVGPKGLKHWFSTQASLQSDWLQQSLPRLWEWDENDYIWAGIPVSAHRTMHTENSLAFRFKGKHHLFYSGDSGPSDALIRFAFESDWALLECSFPDYLNKDGHFCPSECASFANSAKVRKLILTHIYPENDTEDLGQRVGQMYMGPITIAQDFASFEI